MSENRIIVDKDILVGKPIIKGTRISVEFILGLLADGWTYEKILKEYPQLQKKDILAAVRYSLEIVKGEETHNL